MRAVKKATLAITDSKGHLEGLISTGDKMCIRDRYTATQVMIWMIERGWYTYDANTYAFQLNTKAINAAKKICDKSDQSPVGSSYDYFKTIYSKMQTFGTVPSFCLLYTSRCV